MTSKTWRRPPGHRGRNRARGFTLIEVLVSLLVFSVGILGMAGFQALSTRNSVDASERGRAALMANELVAKMWEARSTSLDEAVVEAWKERLHDEAGLNDGEATITEVDDDVGTVMIEITWTSVMREGATSTYFTEFAMPPDTE
jgi:type IV pilus assembly protein PilV